MRCALIASCVLFALSARPLMAEPSVWNLLVPSRSWVNQDGHYQSESPRRPLVEPGRPYRCAITPDRTTCSEITDDGRAIRGTERESR